MHAISLKVLMTGIGESVKEAQYAIRKNEIGDFFSYFDKQSEEMSVCTPKIENIMIPADVSRLHKNTRITVPLAAMVHHKNLLMDEVTITLHGKIGESDGEPTILFEEKGEKAGIQDEIKLVYRCQESTQEQEQVIRTLADNIG